MKHIYNAKKILTIVVPAYNAEKYLKDNLESFFIEDILPDIEVLIINDGSTDGSLAIAESYVSRCPESYRVISKENGGHGSGINYGIQYASGKYFKVVDADDWVVPEAFKKLIQALKRTNSDLVYSGFLWAFDHGEAVKENFKTKAEFDKPFSKVTYEKEYYFDKIADRLYLKMHNITIKTEILRDHGICLNENCFYVDSEYITYPIPYVNTIWFIPEFVYMYRIGRQGQSVGIERMKKNRHDYDRVVNALLLFYEKLECEIPCSAEKKRYISHLIARVIAGKFKIYLNLHSTGEGLYELQKFDNHLGKCYPDIYRSNRNPAIKLLRWSDYRLYGLISWLIRRRYKDSL